MNPTLKKFLPHLIALLSFIIVSFFYFKDIAAGSKQIKQHDIKMYEGSVAEASQYGKSSGETIFFTESMFSGMPMYLINMPYYGNVIFNKLSGIYNLYLPYPVNQFFILMLGFYILLLTFKVNPYMAIAGAFAFALSSNNMVFTAAGHMTKVSAIAYTPLVLAGFHMTLRGNKWFGACLTAIALSFQMGANHFQITYYMLFILGAWYIAELFWAIKDKNSKTFITNSIFLGVAFILGAATGLSGVMVSKEYGDYSIRGKSELTLNKTDDQKAETGLDRDYAFEYSYSGVEPLTILIPNLYGGAEQNEFDKNSETYKLAKSNQNAKELTEYLLGYWGGLRITAGPPYFGAIVIFLFVLGCIIVRSPIRWALIAVTLLSLALSYGRNMEAFNYFMFDHFPYYSKFRAVTTALVIAQVAIPILAFLGLKEFFDAYNRKENVLKKLYYAAGITGGICMLFVIAPGSTVSFTTTNETGAQVLKSKYAQVFGEQGIPPEYEEALQKDCAAIVRNDAIRSIFFILLAGALLFAVIKARVKQEIILGVLALAIAVDMALVDKRWLGPDQLEKKRKQVADSFQKTAADEFILADNKDNARVLNLSLSSFNDATTSFYHRSIGGYHGAKLKRYQELIENHIQPEIQYLSRKLQTIKTDSIQPEIYSGISVLNMLDAKYIIYSADARPLVNNYHLGHCWFVRSYKFVENADSEMVELGKINTRAVCVIDKRYEDKLGGMKMAEEDDDAYIEQKEYHPNHIKYESNSKAQQLAVFSEIYYEPDWEMFIDGNKADYFRCNYVLRAAVIPAGKHTIEFKINAKTYDKWENISRASSYAILLLVIGTLGMYFKNRKRNPA